MAGLLKNKKIAIVGTGFVGRSWAMLYAGAGYQVCLYDEKSDQIASALIEIKKQLDFLETNQILRGKLCAEDQFQLITPATSLAECVRGAFYVQESVFERVDVKRSVFEKLDALVGDDIILASSVSCIPPADFTENMVHRSQVVVAHPVNPPYYAPMVEMVPSPWTKPEFFQRTRDLMIEIGQKPMTVRKHIYGFVSNRIQYSILNECWRLIQDDVVSVEDMETVMSDGLGMRYAFMGPFETAYLNADGWLDYCDRYAKGIQEVSQTFGPVPFFGGDTAQRVQDDLASKVPMDKLTERRRWRDNCLIALSKLKNQQEEN